MLQGYFKDVARQRVFTMFKDVSRVFEDAYRKQFEWSKDGSLAQLGYFKMSVKSVYCMLQGCFKSDMKMLLRMLRECLMNASNVHQGYFQDAKPYDCSLSQLLIYMQ